MSLPAPHLDDRRFQDLVDDAKRLVQQRCPEWTDHNVSDPGVTLIEAFAQMVDQLIYRLNRVPDLPRIKVPVLITTGQHDELTPACAMKMKLALHDAELHVFPNSSHMPFYEEPGAYYPVLLDFLKRNRGERGRRM
jgi:pimeloyl-ACP methyl ester carboxylesterase